MTLDLHGRRDVHFAADVPDRQDQVHDHLHVPLDPGVDQLLIRDWIR